MSSDIILEAPKQQKTKGFLLALGLMLGNWFTIFAYSPMISSSWLSAISVNSAVMVVSSPFLRMVMSIWSPILYW